MVPNALSVRDYLRLIFRRKYSLFVPIILGALLIGPVWVLAPTKYRAEALINREDRNVVKGQSLRSPEQIVRKEMLTYNNLRRILTQLRRDVDLESPEELQAEIQKLRLAVSIDVDARDAREDFISITATVGDPEESARIANAFANNYVERSLKSRDEDFENTIKYLRKRTAEALDNLQKTELDMAKYTEEHLQSIPQVKQSYLRRIDALETERLSRKHQLAALEKQFEQIEKQIESGEVPQTIVAEVLIEENPEYQQLKRQVTERKQVLDQMLVERTEEHPAVIALREEIGRLEEQLENTSDTVEGGKRRIVNPDYSKLVQDRHNMQQQIQGNRAAQLQIEAELAALQQKAEEVAEQERTYNDLERERQMYSQQYAKFRGRLEEAELALDAQNERVGTDVEIHQEAITPTEPYHIQNLWLALACLAGGAGVGITLMLGLEFCDQSLRSVDDAAGFLQIPILGSISMIVSPEEIRRRHRRNLAIGTMVLLLIAAGIGGVAFWNHRNPGAINRVIEEARDTLFPG